MKKSIALSSIIATVILVPNALPAHAETTPVVQDDVARPSVMTNKTIDIKLVPETLKAMKGGYYHYNGIGVGSYMGDLKKMYGQPRYDQILRNYASGKMMVNATYGKGNRLAFEANSNRIYSNASISEMKIQTMYYLTQGKGYLKRDLEKTLGQATKIVGSVNGKGDISREYGPYLRINYERNKDNQWEAMNIELHKSISNGTKSIIKPTGLALQNKDITIPVTAQSIKAMKNNRYMIKGKIGIGSTVGTMKSEFGVPGFEVIERHNGLTEYSSYYGNSGELELSSTKYGYVENAKLDAMNISHVDMSVISDDVFKSDLEKYTGKATYYSGNVKSSDTLLRSYGKHFDVEYFLDEDVNKFAASNLIIHTEVDKKGNYVFNPYMPTYE